MLLRQAQRRSCRMAKWGRRHRGGGLALGLAQKLRPVARAEGRRLAQRALPPRCVGGVVSSGWPALLRSECEQVTARG